MSHPKHISSIPLFSVRRVVVFIASACIAFLGVISVLEVLNEDQPHIRLGETDDRISGLVVTDNSRLLILNTADRSDARSFTGRMARPWEPKPSAVLVSSADYAASGLWEYLQIADPSQVIIAGIPGSDVVWEAVLDHCESRDITVDFVAHSSTITIAPFTLTVLAAAPGDLQASAVVLHRDALNIFMLLDGEPANVQSQLTIGDSQLAELNSSSVAIEVGNTDVEFEGVRLALDGSDVARVYVDHEKIRVRGVRVQH